MKLIDLTHDLGPQTGQPVNQLQLDDSALTRVEAPAAVLEGGAFLDELPVERYFGLALLIEVSGNCIEKEQLERYEEQLAHCQFAALKSNCSKLWGSDAYNSEYPRLSPEAAHYLAGFQLSGLAIDAAAIDDGKGPGSAQHILAEAGLLLVCNITALDEIAGKMFLLSALPLKLHCASSPVRALAFEAPAGIYYPR